MTPDQVHYGQADAVHAVRQLTFDQAFHAATDRIINRTSVPPANAIAAWINPPTPVPQGRT